MQRHDPGILKKPDHRNTLRRCNREVEKDAPIGLHLVALMPDRIQPLAQPKPGFRMLAFTQCDERRLTDDTLQAQPFGTQAEPFPLSLLPLRIVIAGTQTRENTASRSSG